MEMSYKWLFEKKQDPNLPYVALSNNLLRRGDELLLPEPPATHGHILDL
jgi:hypothetical protein